MFSFAANSDLRILILGATGLLGNAVFRGISEGCSATVIGTLRDDAARKFFAPEHADNLVKVDDLEDLRGLARLFDDVRPDVVVNCLAVGRPMPKDPLRLISVHSMLPQRISHLCRLLGVRFLHISSDGVFSGMRGRYTEDDLPDANDVYGVSKLLGEVAGSHAINLRTSIIGHELHSAGGLLEWFLKQQERCRCYTKVIFSGLPTIVLAELLRDVIIPHPELHGVYHVAARPISKFDLLKLVAARYGKTIELIPDDEVCIDRSLVADRFANATGYVPPDWPEMIDRMYSDRFGSARS